MGDIKKREIKFRVWDGDRMRKAFDLTQNPIYWWKENYDHPLMQYTGLKDKNGVEIYEGDVVKEIGGSNLLGVIEFYNGMFVLNPGERPAPAIGGYEYESRLTEVIGNIYENPNLLEAANE